VHFDEAFNEQLKGVDRMGSLDLILARASRTYTPRRSWRWPTPRTATTRN
jgi:hypothetical protein